MSKTHRDVDKMITTACAVGAICAVCAVCLVCAAHCTARCAALVITEGQRGNTTSLRKEIMFS